MKLCLGIDTSCYTTSLALVDSEGNLFCEERKILKVAKGSRGLAQNEAVFQHIQNLPELLERILHKQELSIDKVTASTRPRPQEGSYMPVFKVGESFGRSIAAAMNVPFIASSHQEGHIAAGLLSIGLTNLDDFLAIHMSGGTTEILQVKRIETESQILSYNITLLGGTTDLHAGQFVDRVGVALGLPFPAGPSLEKLAQQSSNEVVFPSSVRGLDLSFSGPETAAQRMIQEGCNPEDIARGVERCIANSVSKLILNASSESGKREVLVVGGVAANLFIRNRIQNKTAENGIRVYFAKPQFSSDNATGVAYIGTYDQHCG